MERFFQIIQFLIFPIFKFSNFQTVTVPESMIHFPQPRWTYFPENPDILSFCAAFLFPSWNSSPEKRPQPEVSRAAPAASQIQAA